MSGCFFDVTSENMQKLLILAGGSTELVIEAIQATSMPHVTERAHGFLWRKKSITLRYDADMEKVSSFIEVRKAS